MRTGSIAMWQVMREIVLKDGGRAPALGSYFLKDANKWAKENKWVLVRLHEYDNFLEEPIGNDRCKVVVTIRDQRDVVVSLMNFNNYGFDTAIHARAFKGNVKNYYEWIEKIGDDDLFIVEYEDFVNHRTRTILHIAEFLGIDLSKAEAEEINKKWDIPANQKRAKQHNKLDSVEYMAERHINSGKANQWKKALTEEQVEYIERDPDVGFWLWDLGYKMHCQNCKKLMDSYDLTWTNDGIFCDDCPWFELEEEE